MKKLIILFLIVFCTLGVNAQDCHLHDESLTYEYDYSQQSSNSRRKLLKDENGIIQINVFFEIDYKAYVLLGKSEANVHRYVAALIEKSKRSFFWWSVNLRVSGINIYKSKGPYYKFDKDYISSPEKTGEALVGALNTFYNMNKDSLVHDLYYYIGGEPIYAGGVAILNAFSNLDAVGFAGQNFNSRPEKFINTDLYVFCHEVGHVLGLPHTHTCRWGDNFDQTLDDCGTIHFTHRNQDMGICHLDNKRNEGASCVDLEHPKIPQNGGTYMSYCHLRDVGIDFKEGFGDEPGNRMYQILKALRTNLPILADTAEVLALQKIYKNLNGANWKNNKGWKEGSFFLNDYYGIQVNPLTGTVGGIFLSDNNLEGELPDAFNDLKYLQHISLRDNKISGSLSGKFDKLGALQSVDLYKNKLSGDFKATYFRSKSLQKLRLDINNLTGVVPDFDEYYENVRSFGIPYNGFEGKIPRSIGVMTKCYDIGLQNNKLTGEVPAELGNLPLRSLGLENNKLSGCFPQNLHNLCKTITYYLIDNGNDFNSTWADFCSKKQGICVLRDIDGDGYYEDVDCDDNDKNVNPGLKEIPYNGIDDDCNPETKDDDLDNDCYPIAIDCNDSNSGVNPLQIDIPDNGIDENCDGRDESVTSVISVNQHDIKVFPNPTNAEITISSESLKDYRIRLIDSYGRLVYQDHIKHDENHIVNMHRYADGLYILKISDVKSNQSKEIKVVKIR